MNSNVFLTECDSFTQAQIVKSFLEAQGFHPKVRDEQMRTIAPHFENLLGKLIIEVPEIEFLAASQALEDFDKVQTANLKLVEPEEEDSYLLHTQGLAKKALTNSILGIIFLPMVCNLYSLVLSWRVIRTERPLTPTSGKRLLLAIIFNSLGFYIWLTFGVKYFLRGL